MKAQCMTQIHEVTNYMKWSPWEANIFPSMPKSPKWSLSFKFSD